MQKILSITYLFFLLFAILEIITIAIAAADDDANKKAILALAIERESRLCWRMYAAWEKAALEEIYAQTEDERTIAIEKQRQALNAWDEKMHREKLLNWPNLEELKKSENNQNR